MPGVYGEQLAVFPELMSDYDVFRMDAKSGGGFTERVPFQTVRGYFSRSVGGVPGFPDGTYVEAEKTELYVYDEIPRGAIRQGMYVEVEGDLYKFEQDNNYVLEGGFSVHRLLYVSGPTDQQLPNLDAEEHILDGFR